MDIWREKHEALGWTYKLWTESDLREQIVHVDGCIAKLQGGPDGGYKPKGCLCPRTRVLDDPRHRALFQAFDGIYHAQADILRYAVLHQFGGVYLDADTECVQPLDDRFLDVDEGVWSVRENDHSALLACGFMGAEPRHRLLAAVLNELLLLDVHAIKDETRAELYGAAWVLTGPACLSEVVKASGIPIYAWPSYYFIPEHHDGTKYEGDGTVFGRHWWGTTFKRYTAGT
jgi:mannosyltransferase OCH1-like enzyme